MSKQASDKALKHLTYEGLCASREVSCYVVLSSVFGPLREQRSALYVLLQLGSFPDMERVGAGEIEDMKPLKAGKRGMAVKSQSFSVPRLFGDCYRTARTMVEMIVRWSFHGDDCRAAHSAYVALDSNVHVYAYLLDVPGALRGLERQLTAK